MFRIFGARVSGWVFRVWQFKLLRCFCSGVSVATFGAFRPFGWFQGSGRGHNAQSCLNCLNPKPRSYEVCSHRSLMTVSEGSRFGLVRGLSQQVRGVMIPLSQLSVGTEVDNTACRQTSA